MTRPCLGCGRLCAGTRCESCQRERERTRDRLTAHQRGYDDRYRAARARVLAGAHTCAICGKGIDPAGTWPGRHPLAPSADHIVPVSRDPSRAHDPSNLRAVHYGCNSARGNGAGRSIERTW